MNKVGTRFLAAAAQHRGLPVHVLATDAHDTKYRVPLLSLARERVAKLRGDEVARALVDNNPRAIINDKPLPYFPNPVIKKSGR